jgi:hypothetical protein
VCPRGPAFPICLIEQEDILTEARAHGGRVLVTRETEAQAGANGGSARQVVEIYEPVTGPEAVQTPKQVRGVAWMAWRGVASCQTRVLSERLYGCGADSCGNAGLDAVPASASLPPTHTLTHTQTHTIHLVHPSHGWPGL